MKIEVTELESCKLSVHYEANALEIMDKRSEVFNAFKKAPVPGFRPNKASDDAIRHHYRDQIEESLKRALAEDAYHNTLFDKKLRPHGAPRFNNLLLDGGKFVCEFEIYTKPEFDAPVWKDMEIPRPHANTDALKLAEQMMQEIRVRLGEAEPYAETDFVQMNDNIIVDYEGTVDGQKVDHLCAQGELMTIGSSPLEGFDNNLLGMVLNETREFDFVAPEGGLPSLSGKTVHFKVTVSMGSKIIPCNLDDTLAQKMGKKDFFELQQFVSQAAFARVANQNQAAIHDAISKKLVVESTVEVPNWMSLSEAQYLAQQSSLDWNVMSDADKEKMLELAVRNVKLTLILDKIRETEPQCQLTDQEVFEIIKKNLAQTKSANNLDEVIQQMSKSGYLQILFSRIKDAHTIEYITKSAKIID
ncbi:MAG TPA: trigger factor [Candidatus Saccharimonadales bacterium]